MERLRNGPLSGGSDSNLIYEGSFNNLGQKHGYGKLTDTVTHACYDGQWQNDLRSGQGTQHYATGETYTGEWKQDVCSGSGCVSYPPHAGKKSGETHVDKFVGLFQGGTRTIGTWVFKESHIYSQVWTRDMPGPEGEIIFSTRDTYRGQVGCSVQGKYTLKCYYVFRHGYGEMQWVSGESYFGNWKNDKKKGFGVSLATNGEKYWGFWKGGKKHGYGIELQVDGSYYEGEWHSGDRKGRGKVSIPTGSVVIGEWAGNKISSSVFHKGKFDDVPRPLRNIFEQDVVKKPIKDSCIFLTSKKWTGIIDAASLSKDPSFDFDTLQQAFRTIKSSESTNPVAEVIFKFCYIFNSIYGSLGNDKKNITYHLQNAIDDILSFLSAIGKKIASISGQNNAGVMSNFVMELIFPSIHDSLFQLYTLQYRKYDVLLSIKSAELRKVTPSMLGIQSHEGEKPKNTKVKRLPYHPKNKTPTDSPSPHMPTSDLDSRETKLLTDSAKPLPAPPQLQTYEPTTNSARTEQAAPSKSPVASLQIVPVPEVRTIRTTSRTPRSMTSSQSPRESPGQNKTQILALTSSTQGESPRAPPRNASRENPNAPPRDASKNSNPKKAPKPKDDTGPEITDPAAKKLQRPEKADPRHHTKKDKTQHRKKDATNSTTPPEEAHGSPKSPRKTKHSPPKSKKDAHRGKSIDKKPKTSEPGESPRDISVDPSFLGQELAKTIPAFLNSPAFKKYSESNPGLVVHDTRLARRSRFSPARQTIKDISEACDDDEAKQDEFSTSYYPQVLRQLKAIESCTSPASQLGVLSRVFSKITALSTIGAISPSDRFLILTYAVIRCPIKHMYSVSRFLVDFTTEFVQNDKQDIQLSELTDVLDYVSTLDWNIRDEQQVLIPHNSIINSVVMASKTVSLLKLPTAPNELHETMTSIQLTLSSIFRKLGQQDAHTIYQPFPLSPPVCHLIHEHHEYMKTVIEARGTGLKLCATEFKFSMEKQVKGFGVPLYSIHFETKHPLFVYLKLSDIVITLESESFT